MSKSHSAPIICAILLLLPVLYVGSYLALVKPYYRPAWVTQNGALGIEYEHYRWGGAYAAKVFWPLEQVDRRVRPGAWDLWTPVIRGPGTVNTVGPFLAPVTPK